MITFTSSSTVSNFVQLCGGDSLAAIVGSRRDRLHRADHGEDHRRVGRPVAVMAREFTIDGLLAAMVAYFSGSKN